MKSILLNFIGITIVIYGSFSFFFTKTKNNINTNLVKNKKMNTKEIATFGGGCFWCTEAVFEELEGVTKVASGYSGGFTDNPTYKEICSGNTGHAEVIHVTFNPEKIPYAALLDVFFATHNPTTLNRQGADVGTQYRSAIFYHNKKQKEAALQFINALEKAHVFEDKIVTEVTKFDFFYKASAEHQDFYKNNPTNSYCNAVLNPKLIKFRKQFKAKLKK